MSHPIEQHLENLRTALPDAGRHVRSALGTSSLCGRAALVPDAVFGLKG
ncbi:MAG: hypothetical protein KIT18_15725 [Burkholderiales bacterium]|nr:hypothetical protein [Burkholderiales bacterium]